MRLLMLHTDNNSWPSARKTFASSVNELQSGSGSCPQPQTRKMRCSGVILTFATRSAFSSACWSAVWPSPQAPRLNAWCAKSTTNGAGWITPRELSSVAFIASSTRLNSTRSVRLLGTAVTSRITRWTTTNGGQPDLSTMVCLPSVSTCKSSMRFQSTLALTISRPPTLVQASTPSQT